MWCVQLRVHLVMGKTKKPARRGGLCRFFCFEIGWLLLHHLSGGSSAVAVAGNNDVDALPWLAALGASDVHIVNSHNLTLSSNAGDGGRCCAVYLQVFTNNPRAIKCYEHAGFTEKKTEPDAFTYGDELWGCRTMVIQRTADP